MANRWFMHAASEDLETMLVLAIHCCYNNVPHICVSESAQHWFRKWIVAYSVPIHYLIQCLVIINWTIRNNLQWIFNQNSNFFIQENAFENVVCQNGGHFVQGRLLFRGVNFIMSTYCHCNKYNHFHKKNTLYLQHNFQQLFPVSYKVGLVITDSD